MAMTSIDKKLWKAMIQKNAKRKEKVQDALAAFITAKAAVIGRSYWLTIQGKSAQQSYGHPMDLPRLPTYQPLLMHCQTNLTSTLQSTKQSFGHTVNIH